MSNDTTLTEAFDYFVEQIQKEDDNFDGEIPQHAEAYLSRRSADLIEAATMADMAVEMADDPEDLDQDEMVSDIEEAAVDMFLALVTLQYERDLDIPSAIEDRISFLEDYNELQTALDKAETRQEEMEALDEHMTEALEKEMGGMGQPTTAGSNVDAESYEHDGTERSFH